MRLYLNERPRAFIVTLGSGALVVRHPFPEYIHKSKYLRESSNADRVTDTFAKVIVEFVSADQIDLTRYKEIVPRSGRLNGLLGFLNVKKHIFIGFVTAHKHVALPVIGENVQQIESTEFYCLNSDAYDKPPQPLGEDGDRPASYRHKAHTVKKLLDDGTFYFSREFDVTANLQERGILAMGRPYATLFADTPNGRPFWWNRFMNRELIEFRNKLNADEQAQFDRSGFLICVTRGYARTLNTVVGEDQALLTVTTKLGCGKKGPLFGDWGCDDDGNVANYAESEVVVYTARYVMLYVVVRGNVPLFYSIEKSTMKRNLITTQRIKKLLLDRLFDVLQHACQRHFEKLTNAYGEVHVVNIVLPDSLKLYKRELRNEFKQHVAYLNAEKLREIGALEAVENAIGGDPLPPAHTPYAVNYTEIPSTLLMTRKYGYSGARMLWDSSFSADVINFGALFYSHASKEYIGKQLGVFRITLYNLAEKANFVSKAVCQEVLELAFHDLGIEVDPDVLTKHAQLWLENNDAVKKVFTQFALGTDKIHHQAKHLQQKLHFKKKLPMTTRAMSSNELAMLKLLGRLQEQVAVTLHNPIHDYVDKELKKALSKYLSYQDILVFASTFNVNGECYDGLLQDWLFPPKYPLTKSYDIVFIGIQEIVELLPGKMVNVDASNKRYWEKHLKRNLDRHNPEGAKYVPLWLGQMGGIALFFLVKNSQVKNVHAVEGSYKKTGLGGMSANKGGVGISFKFSQSTVCLVLAHLAAGLNNVVERHQNYKTIAKGIQFSKNRRVRDHDVVIWLGDFNYRLDLSNEATRSLIKKQDYAKLFEYDQLNREMAAGELFPFYDEMEIKFPPTYKFDNGTKRYDTLEKHRSPAWTDRILLLSKEMRIKQLVYDCDPDIVFSDHRPVYAQFNLLANIINSATKKQISKELIENYRQKHGGIDEILKDSNLMYLFEDTLPPPLSDKTKWWLEGHKQVKVLIPELQNGNCFINPQRPANPFEVTPYPEFVSRQSLSN